MRILCTNDDGIHAPGLKVIEEIARALSDDVWVVAPELDQSGVSHSLSLNDPLRLREVGPRHFAVRGTPTDCVIMGARHILGDKLPDLVLSGVNKGRNVAEDVVYSGTIAGAMEGTILGLPSFALSQEFSIETREKPLWDTALKFGPAIIRKVVVLPQPDGPTSTTNSLSAMSRSMPRTASVSSKRLTSLRSETCAMANRSSPWWRRRLGRRCRRPCGRRR